MQVLKSLADGVEVTLKNHSLYLQENNMVLVNLSIQFFLKVVLSLMSHLFFVILAMTGIRL